MSTKKVLFVINSNAGNNTRNDLNECIIEYGKKLNYQYHIHELGNNPLDEIKAAIEDYDPEIIATLGGDGTVNMVAQLIQNTSTKVLIIPYGSANGMAKEFDMPEKVEDCIQLIENGKNLAIDLLDINQQTSIHLADVGLNARIVKRFQLDNKRGLITYAKHLFNEVFFIKSNTFYLHLDNGVRKVKAVSLTFANATKYGTGAVINPSGKLNDGLFEICIVKPFPKSHLFSIALQMFRNRLKYSEFFETIHCKEALVKCKRRTTLQIDGEIYGKVKEIKLKSLNKVLNIIIPQKSSYPTLID